MEVLLLQKPHEVCFSGNPVAFTFIVTPYTDVEHAEDIGLNVSVEVEEGFGTFVFTTARQNIYLPNASGIIEIAIQYILQAYLTQYRPALNLATSVICEGQARRYRLSYQLIVNGNLVTQLATSDIFTVIKGGMPYEEWHPRKFFNQFAGNRACFLRYGVNEERVHADEIKFLNWIYGLNQTTPVRIIGEVHYHDKSLERKDITPLGYYGRWQIAITPAGFMQTGLDALATDNRIPLFYDISVVDAAYTKLSDPQRFVLDYRQFYNTYNLMFTNSLGGIETLRLRGQVEAQAEYLKTQAERVTPANYFLQGVLQSPSVTTYANESEKFTGDTGFITREKLDRLRDIFLSRDCLYEIRAGKLVPISIDAKSVKLYTSTDKLYSLSVDWRNAFTNEYYAPDSLLMIESTTCPVPVSFFVRQVKRSSLQVIWALEPEYDQVQIEFPGDSGDQQIILDGNSGQQEIYFLNPRIADPDLIAPIILKARTICEGLVDPMSVSAWAPVSLNLFADLPPVAIDDNFTLPRGITTLTQLDGNLLSNDYDPDGDPIECVPVSNQLTEKGGRITITKDGKPAYAAPNALFEGEDSYAYTIREVAAPSVTATAWARITVGNAATGSVVYARIVLRNLSTKREYGGFGATYSAGDVTRGEVWIDYFTDAIGTLPADITSLNITVNYVRTSVFNPFGNPVTTDTPGSVQAKTNKTKIYADILSVKHIFGPSFADQSLTFKLTAGTGYSAI